jgi:hypothetical protein
MSVVVPPVRISERRREISISGLIQVDDFRLGQVSGLAYGQAGPFLVASFGPSIELIRETFVSRLYLGCLS